MLSLRFRVLTPRTRTLTLMVLGVGAVVAAETWDARHEASAVLADLTHDHELLALALAAKMEPSGVDGSVEAGREHAYDAVCKAARSLEQAGALVIAVARADVSGLWTCRAQKLVVPSLERAARSGVKNVTLSRDEAVRLGLPERVAVAGIAPMPPRTGLLAVIVGGSAATERDRSRRQQARTMVSIAFVTALILGFGQGAERPVLAFRELGLELSDARLWRCAGG